jgi:CRP/FNR family cyclic AMP-dependent transcriptional regulator
LPLAALRTNTTRTVIAPANSIEDKALMERALRITQGFATWPAAPMGQLLAHSRLGHHERGSPFSTETDEPETLAIVSGRMVMGRTPPGGTRAVFAFIGPGSVVGLARSLDGKDQSVHDFSAHSKSVVAIHMPTRRLLEVLAREPALWKDMALMLLRQHRDMLDTLLGQVIGPFPQRLAATIERLSRLYGSTAAGHARQRLKVTQADLAGVLQVTRQTVNKELKSLAETGAIALDYNAVTVLDIEALRKITRSR